MQVTQRFFRTRNTTTGEAVYSDGCPNLRDLGPDGYQIDRITVAGPVLFTADRLENKVARGILADQIVGVEVVYAEIPALSGSPAGEPNPFDAVEFAPEFGAGPIPYHLTERGLAELVA